MSERPQSVPLDKHIDLLTGFAFPSSGYSEAESDVRLLRGDNVVQGRIRWQDAKRWPHDRVDNLQRYYLQEGDIVVALDRTWVKSGLKVSVIAKADLPCLLVQRVARIRARATLDQRFMHHCIFSHSFEQHVKGSQTESAVPHISPLDVRNFHVPIPSLGDQRRIAAILDEWDKAIAATEKLVNAKKDRKRAISQRLFAQTQPRSASNWRLVTFDELFKEFERPNSDQGATVITVGKYAIRPQSEHFNNSVSSKDLTGYKVISRGDFVYDPMSAYYGAIGRYDLDTVGVVSPAYRTLHITELWTSDFAVYALDTEFIRFQLEARSSQGNKDGKRRVLQREEFGAIEIRLPDIEQQRQFASLMSSAEQDLKYQMGLRDQLRLQKRGLMQKLLSGDWPVPASIDRLLPGGQDIDEAVGAEVKRAEATG